MARPWKNAALICTVVTIAAGLGIVVGLLTGNLLWPLILLSPAVAYEAYRTAGESTRWASWMLVVLLAATIVLIVWGIDYDLRQLFGEEEAFVAGQVVPLGDIKMVMPAVMGICAVILLLRTRGRYTRWLAVVIFVAALFIVYTMDPEAIGTLVKVAMRRLIW